MTTFLPRGHELAERVAPARTFENAEGERRPGDAKSGRATAQLQKAQTSELRLGNAPKGHHSIAQAGSPG